MVGRPSHNFQRRHGLALGPAMCVRVDRYLKTRAWIWGTQAALATLAAIVVLAVMGFASGLRWMLVVSAALPVVIALLDYGAIRFADRRSSDSRRYSMVGGSRAQSVAPRWLAPWLLMAFAALLVVVAIDFESMPARRHRFAPPLQWSLTVGGLATFATVAIVLFLQHSAIRAESAEHHAVVVALRRDLVLAVARASAHASVLVSVFVLMGTTEPQAALVLLAQPVVPFAVFGATQWWRHRLARAPRVRSHGDVALAT